MVLLTLCASGCAPAPRNHFYSSSVHTTSNPCCLTITSQHPHKERRRAPSCTYATHHTASSGCGNRDTAPSNQVPGLPGSHEKHTANIQGKKENFSSGFTHPQQGTRTPKSCAGTRKRRVYSHCLSYSCPDTAPRGSPVVPFQVPQPPYPQTPPPQNNTHCVNCKHTIAQVHCRPHGRPLTLPTP